MRGLTGTTRRWSARSTSFDHDAAVALSLRAERHLADGRPGDALADLDEAAALHGRARRGSSAAGTTPHRGCGCSASGSLGPAHAYVTPADGQADAAEAVLTDLGLAVERHDGDLRFRLDDRPA